MTVISFNRENGKYGCFSNFYSTREDSEFSLVIDDVKYMSTEHYYQTMKFDVDEKYHRRYQKIIRNCDTCYKSKILGHQSNLNRNIDNWRVSDEDTRLLKDIIRYYKSKGVHMRDDFEDNKIKIMYRCVYKKFKQNEHLRDILISTGESDIEERSYDRFWGTGYNGGGRNELGKILMKVRDKLK